MQEISIEFRPSAFYLQKQNRLSKRKGRTLIEYIRSIILERAILDNLWSELLLAMIYISNLLLTFLLDGFSSYKTSTELPP